ncbi:MAG: hypothetical protein H0V54_11810 [Chthoniobacterales bacterium]|nr:hypothetical protein [Chthoniobacterales bacterium]
MPSSQRSRTVALAFFLSGWVACAAAFLLPLPARLNWIQTVLFIYGSSAILFGGGTALFRHFDVRAKAALARGENVIARWWVEPESWREFVEQDRSSSGGAEFLPNELSFPNAVPEEGVEVVVGKNAVQVGESIHRLTGGIPEVTAAILHDSRPGVVELQLYYPGGGHGASGVPHAPRRATLRFPVGRGYWKEAGAVVSHYRGDAPREPDLLHGKGDGTNPEDLTRCYNCGYETYKLMSHCPQCGRGMQSKRWSRRYGVVLVILGLVISIVIGFVLLALLPRLHHPRGSGFSDTGAQATLALVVLGAVETFGVTVTCYGVWQVVTGRRSKWVIYFALGIVIFLLLFALSL